MDKQELILKNIEELRSTNEQIAFRAIGELKRSGKTAVPALIHALKEGGSLRTMAIVVLGEIGKDAVESIPVLSGLLYEDNEETRMATALTLSRIGSESLPYLLQIAVKDNGMAGFWSSWAIAMINPSVITKSMINGLNRERENPSSMFTSLAAEEAFGKIIAAELENNEEER